MVKKKKENKKLPELPSLKQNLDEFPSFPLPPSEKAPSQLPTFPNVPTDTFSQTAIKQAIAKEQPSQEELKNEFMPDESWEQKPHTTEMQEWTPQQIPIQAPSAVPSAVPPAVQPNEIQTQYTPVKKDIYVKIDKFNSAKRTLQTVKDALEDVEFTLAKIRETKMREEQELSGWEKELLIIKARINDISQSIFEKE